MTDLVSRLLEAIGETERLAGYRDDDWRTDPDSWHTRSCGYGQGELMEDCDCEVPSSVLRRCAADRKMVELHSRMTITSGHPYFNDAHLTREPMTLCRSCEPETQWRRERSWPCRTILTLASAYGLSDHQEGEE